MDDAHQIFEQYAQDEEVTKYLTWRPHKSLADTRDFLRKCQSDWEEGTAFTWVIMRRDTNHLIGMIGIRIRAYKMDLGYVLARKYWGHGYMTEAVRAVIDWGMKQTEIFRIWALCDVENYASARVLEKAGMQREGRLRRNLIHPNIGEEPRDCYCYAIVK